MIKVNLDEVPVETWDSPKGKYGGSSKSMSVALGRQEDSTDLQLRHPFDVEISRVPPGKIACPFHSHSAQWEYYQVMKGSGVVRHASGKTDIVAGDAFLFRPGEPHQILNPGTEELVLCIVADNPIGESCFYPDSNKWLVRTPGRQMVQATDRAYYQGEE